MNSCKTDEQNLIASLENDGVEISKVTGMLFSLRHTGDISKLAAFRDGHFIVMDAGALAAVDSLCAKPNQTIVDLCAAPGGKSFAAAFAMQNTGRILACDIHTHRVELIRQTQKRLGLSIIETAVHDATVFNPKLQNIADAVLLDAPCSGLGTIRKHPEIKYTRTPEDISFLAQKQSQMLANAAKYVKIDGVLVYCTCTVAAEENTQVTEKFIAAHENFTLQSANQVLPCENSDGFYTAKFLRGK
jgi:16S rRNA (cytosine967-C5)-methyltransferase